MIEHSGFKCERLVVQVGGRFFRNFGWKNRAITAWNVSAAKFFSDRPEAANVVKRLLAKGKTCVIRTVRIEVLGKESDR